MHNRIKISITINLVFILIGLGLVGFGIYYHTKPLPPFMHIMSADKEGSVSAKNAAEFLTAMSLSRPWDATLAEQAEKAKQQADSQEGTRVLFTALFVIGGIALGVFGGLRIAKGLKENSCRITKGRRSQNSVGFAHLHRPPERPKHLVGKSWQLHEDSKSGQYAIGIGLQSISTRELKQLKRG